jgi:hypothetical protein
MNVDVLCFARCKFKAVDSYTKLHGILQEGTRKSEKTKYAHMKMEINGNATKTNTN